MCWYGVGLVLGSCLVAAVAVVLGGLVQSLIPAAVRIALLGTATLIVLLRELQLIEFPVPQRRRLVAENVTRRGPTAGPVQFGFEMGTGMRTYSPSALPHLLLLAMVLALPPAWSFAAATGFAAARWLRAAASIGYDDDGAWSDAWTGHQRPLSAVSALAVTTALVAGIGSQLWW